MKGKLTRLIGGENLRSDTVEGACIEPKVGRRFRLIAPPLDPSKDHRFVETSPVVQVERWVEREAGFEGWEFMTETGSVYRVEVVQ